MAPVAPRMRVRLAWGLEDDSRYEAASRLMMVALGEAYHESPDFSVVTDSSRSRSGSVSRSSSPVPSADSARPQVRPEMSASWWR